VRLASVTPVWLGAIAVAYTYYSNCQQCFSCSGMTYIKSSYFSPKNIAK